MSQSKKLPLKRPDVIAREERLKQSLNDETASCLAVTVEYDSCYRGKIEIWKDGNGEVVSQKIIR
jgi:hypothetical protein